EAKVGQSVTRGRGVVVVEAMKMENEVRASDSGVVKEIRVKERQTVEKGEVLVVIE
ncbi:MAG: biotin/lipoyl-binding protein, partial [Calditrichaeota bacterium]|nr:biotin/lipoyl-binding protein [Calditrichota bacterium]